MKFFQNKVVWVTGASSGIGEALSYALAKEGARLVLSARNQKELERVENNCNLPKENIMILPFDLESISEMEIYAKSVITKFQKIDILINNGGISQRSLAKETPLDVDRKIMEVNFFGTVALTKAVLPFMLKQRTGNIVIISSIAGKFGYYFRSAYSASKHALHGFFESLRLETEKDNIKVNIICPGKIRTSISINALNEAGEKNNKMDRSQEKGMSTEKCAQQILEAIEKNKKEVFIGGKELNMVWIKRYFPKLFSVIIRKIKPE